MNAKDAAVRIQNWWRTHLLGELREAEHQQFVIWADEPTQEELDKELENKLNVELGFPIDGINPKTRRQLQKEEKEYFLQYIIAMDEKYHQNDEEMYTDTLWWK